MAAESGLPGDFQANSGENTVLGSSLLVVVGEPFTDDCKGLVLERIAKGIKTWDSESAGCDINAVLNDVASQAPEALVGDNGEVLVEDAGDNVQVSVLINPHIESMRTKLQNFLKSKAKYRHFVYAGHAFQGSGNWVLQDDCVSFAKFIAVFKEAAVSNALKEQDGGILSVNVFPDGDWSAANISKQPFSKVVKVKFNPDAKLEDTAGIEQFVSYLSEYVRVIPTKNLLKASDVVGNIRFSRPTLYIFPGCQGDSALIGISGFNLLVNGGYSRKSCFWDFARHLDRIDAMMLTHLGEDNLFGVSSVLKRKVEENVHPEIGYMLFNGVEKHKHSPNGDLGAEHGGLHKEASLYIDLIEEGDKLMENMAALGHSPNPCLGKVQGQTVQPINLYHKVGHGSLDMYVLNPMQDSKDLKEFLSQWNKHGSAFTNKSGIPLPNMLSVCSLLVWRPASPSDKITRILFPGGVPQSKLFEGLDKLKNVNIFQRATCSEASLAEPPAKVKKGLGVKAPVSKSSPSESQRSSPRGSIKDKAPIERIKPAAKPSVTKTQPKPTKEPAKKIGTKEKKAASPKPAPIKKKTDDKLQTSEPKHDVVSPTASTETEDSAVAISEASTADLAQIAAAVKEEMMGTESSREEKPVDVSDIQPTIEEPEPQLERAPALVDLSASEEQQGVTREVEGEAMDTFTGDQFGIEQPVEAHVTQETREESLQSTPGSEAPSNITHESADLQEISPAAETPQLLDFGESNVQEVSKDLDSPEPLPDPQQFNDIGLEAPELNQAKTVEHDDEKDIDTSEAHEQLERELMETAVVPTYVVEAQQAPDFEEREEVRRSEEEREEAEQKPEQLPAEPQFEEEASKSEDLSKSDIEPSPVADMPQGDVSGFQFQQQAEQEFSVGASEEPSPMSEQPVMGEPTQDPFSVDPMQMQVEDQKPMSDHTFQELSGYDPVTMQQDTGDQKPMSDQILQELSGYDPVQPQTDAQPVGEGGDLKQESQEDVAVRGTGTTEEQPFDGAEPEGLPSPREMPDVIPDEMVCTPDSDVTVEAKNVAGEPFVEGFRTEENPLTAVDQNEIPVNTEANNEVRPDEQEMISDEKPMESFGAVNNENEQLPDVPQLQEIAPVDPRDFGGLEEPEIEKGEKDKELQQIDEGPSNFEEKLPEEERTPSLEEKPTEIEEQQDETEKEPIIPEIELTDPDTVPEVCDDSLVFGDGNADGEEIPNESSEVQQKYADSSTDDNQLPEITNQEIVQPPECDLYSATNPLMGLSQQEPLEPQPEERGAIYSGESFMQDPLQSWSDESAPNTFQGLTPQGDFEQNSHIPFESSPQGDAPEAVKDQPHLEQNTEEFDPLKEWGMPQGLPALSPGAEGDKKKTGTKTETKSNTKPGAAKGRVSSATSKPATTVKSSTTTKKPPATDAAKEPSKRAMNATSTLSAAKKPASAPAKTTAANGAKTEPKKAALNTTLSKKPSPTGTKKPATTVTKKPPPTKSLDTSTMESRKLNTSVMESKAPSRTIGAKRPATTPATRAPAPVKQLPVTPFYIDLAYIPYHGDLHYMNLDYFRRCRARYYVYSSLQPKPEVLDLLLDAKKSWDDPNAEVTVIPTYDNEALRYWMKLNNERLNELKVDIAPSASRCTIQLQDHETSCAAYRLEF